MRITQATAQLKPAMTDRAQRFINTLVEESQLLRVLNTFMPKGTEFQYRPATGGQTVEDRAINGDYTGDDLDPATLIAGTLAIAGFTLDYDLTYKRDHDNGLGIDMDSWYDQELIERAVETAEAIEKRIVAGTGTANQMKGWATILDGTNNIPGLGITGVINALTGSGLTGDSFDLSNEDNWGKFLEQYEKWKAELGGDVIVLCNKSMKARLATIARKYNSWGQGFDQFGKPINKIDENELVKVEDSVITNTEPDDAATPVEETTSIYLITNRVGHANINTNSGLAFYDVGELQDDMAERIKFEFTGAHEIKTKRTIRRIRNIKLF